MSNWMTGEIYVGFVRLAKSLEADFKCCVQTKIDVTGWDPGKGEAAIACVYCFRQLTFTEADLLILFADNPFGVEVEI